MPMHHPLILHCALAIGETYLLVEAYAQIADRFVDIANSLDSIFFIDTWPDMESSRTLHSMDS